MPLHPSIVHLPIVLTFIMPVLVIAFAWMIKNNKMSPKGWILIMGLQLAVVISGYVSLETGETEEETVSRVVSKDYIHEHEEAAEIFVGSTVLALVLSIAVFFIRKEIQFPVTISIAVIGLISCYLAYKTGQLGGELVYKHGAASAYGHVEETSGLLPTPGIQTSESSVEENESLKTDDNDYGNDGEHSDSPDDDTARQED
jgi:uncharacterized membrane protein